MQTGIAIPLIPILPFHPFNLDTYSNQDWLLLAVIAVLTIALQITNAKSLQYLEASVYSILYNLRIIFTSVLGVVFIGEDIVPLQILGGLLIFLAILTVRQKGKHSLTARGIRWGILTSLVISFLNLFEKIILNQLNILDYVIPVFFFCTAAMWVILLARVGRPQLKTFWNPRMASLMGLRATSAYGFELALAGGGKLSISNYISSLSVILTVIFGVLWLNERDYMRQKVFAVTLAALGLTAIFLARL